MIAYIQGNIDHLSPSQVYIDTGGVAYDINISVHTYEQLKDKKEVKLYTHLIVREDAHSLYGFIDVVDKGLFIKLISVSGIGPNTGRTIMSYMTSDETKRAILNSDVVAFKRVKGIGAKTAQRIILDLKDKINLEGSNTTDKISISAPSSIREETVSALVALGFQKAKISKSIDDILKNEPEITKVEALIKRALRQLS